MYALRDEKWYSRYDRFYEIIADLRDDANVLLIGGNDGVTTDPVYHVWKESWSAYVIEPDPEARNRFRENREGVLLPYAIGTGDAITLYRMASSIDALYFDAMDMWGSSLTGIDRANIEEHIRENLPHVVEEMGMDDLIEEIEVECVTIPELIKRGELPQRIDAAQIDAEGMDDVAARQCFGIVPVIMWEHLHYGEKRKKGIEQEAVTAGYRVERLRNDTVAWMP